jgi:hypothetical protein
VRRALAWLVVLAGCSSTGGASAPPDKPDGAATSSEGQDPGALPTNAPPVDTMKPGYQRLLAEMQRIVTTQLHTAYQHTTYVDEPSHTYDVDCSGFVDYAAARAVPDAFATLQAGTVARPVAKSYVAFIGGLTAPSARWNRRLRAASLVAGDIVAWLEPPDLQSTNTGHVMVVGGAVVPVTGEVHVPVIDSVESGHGSNDLRTINQASGVGQGTIALIVDSNGAPTAYRWSTDRSSLPHQTTIAMASLN